MDAASGGYAWMIAVVGGPVFDGGPETTAVAVESTLSDPAPLAPVTRNLTVDAASPWVSVYVAPVAFGMSTQLPPSASQRRHW